MSADPTFTIICDGKSGDLSEEVRVASTLVKLFNAWKRDAGRKPVDRSPWSFWGPWTKSNSMTDKHLEKR